MIRRALRFLLGAILKLFFRRIELAGLDRVPAVGPVLFATNHPNALVDPLFLLCFAPRPVSFLAKAPLFRMPLIGWLARALDAIPVYRRQDDDSEPSRNRETFARARALLERGGTIAIAPEGTSHSGPALRPIKSGAARIALGAGTREPIRIVPVGLFYTRKGTFRSDALVLFGQPFAVEPVAVTASGEPPAERVDQVTDRIEQALKAVVLEADEHDALDLAARTERLLVAGAGEPSEPTLTRALVARQRLARGYQVLRATSPLELERLLQRVERLEAELAGQDLDPADLAPSRFSTSRVLLAALLFLVRTILIFPLAMPGLLIHYPAYRLIGRLARRVAADHDDLLATAKIIGAMILFPLTWILVGLAVGRALGWPAGVLAGLLAPGTGYSALFLVERLDRFLAATRAFGLYLFERESFARLADERDSLRHELLALADRLGV